MNTDFRVTASRLSGGEPLCFGNITDLRLYSSLDSPADSFSVVCAVDSFPGELGDIKLYADGKLLFSGKTDRQKHSLGTNGRLLTLEARSAGALPLDNQAQPCTLLNARLTTIFNKCIAPYGFSLYNPNRSASLPLFTVRAGMSEWDALVNFARRVYNITPYVRDMQVMLERPFSESPLTISNSGGLPYSRLTHLRTPYNMISKVVLRDENGNYSASVSNSAAAYAGVIRKRYVIPSNEYIGYAALDGNQRIKQSMFSCEQAEATLPGVIDAALGRDVVVKDGNFTLYNLMVSARELTCGKHGAETKLTLQNPVYYL